MLNRIFPQSEYTNSPIPRYVLLGLYIFLGALVFATEISDPAHDLLSVLRRITLYIALIIGHLASCFKFGPRLEVIIRVAAILALVATLAVVIDDFRRLSIRAAEMSRPADTPRA